MRMGAYGKAETDAAIATHAADLDAHTKNLLEIILTGNTYFQGGGTWWGGPTAYTPGANVLWAIPFGVARAMSFDRIAIHVSTLKDPSNIRLGIYADGTNCYPGALVLDAGTVSGATTGVKAVTISPAQSLTKGLYWLVLVADDATVAIRFSYPNSPIIGMPATSFGGVSSRWSVAFTYAALPDPFTAGGALGGDIAPIIVMRPSSLD